MGRNAIMTRASNARTHLLDACVECQHAPPNGRSQQCLETPAEACLSPPAEARWRSPKGAETTDLASRWSETRKYGPQIANHLTFRPVGIGDTSDSLRAAVAALIVSKLIV
jgi:hypothetical protein